MSNIFQRLTIWLQLQRPHADRGASLIEYALLVALIATVCVIAVRVLGEQASTSYSTTASHVINAN